MDSLIVYSLNQIMPVKLYFEIKFMMEIQNRQLISHVVIFGSNFLSVCIQWF